MVKIKIVDSEWEHLKQYVGNTYDAFKLEFDDGRVDYQVQIDKCMTAIFSQAECEEIEDEPMTELASVAEENPEKKRPEHKVLLVEDGSVDLDDLKGWCSAHNIKMVIYRSGSNRPEFLF